MKLSKKFKGVIALTLSIAMVSAINVSTVMADDDPLLVGTAATVTAPKWNEDNIPDRDTSGTVSYWYAGNEFWALNQLNDGEDPSQEDTGLHGSKHMRQNCYEKLIDYEGEPAIQSYGTTSNPAPIFTQNEDITDTVWELMDTDAIWDDQYLFAQYCEGNIMDKGTMVDFAPNILNAVESWYNNGFSYKGYFNVGYPTIRNETRPTVTANGKSWFSDAEKEAVKPTTINTDGVADSANTTANDTLENAHLFAPSVDEVYYNPMTMNRFVINLREDYSDKFYSECWVCPRSYMWTRSFYGTYYNNIYRGAFGVMYAYVGSHPELSATCMSSACAEFAVAPAFLLNTKKVIMAKEAIAGSLVDKDAGLSEYKANGLGSSIKFLISDSTFAPDFTSSVNNTNCILRAGDTYRINYEGAVTLVSDDSSIDGNSALAISAILYDEDGRIAYYGPISEVASESGTATLSIPNDMDAGKYTLAIFEEQLGGTSTYYTKNNSNNGTKFTQTNGGKYTSYETDYQSAAVSYTTLNVIDDSHTGVTLTNENAVELSSGSAIEASKVSGVYTSLGSTSGDAINAEDIYVIPATDWYDGGQDKNNEKLAKSLTLTADMGENFEYYVIVLDDSTDDGYWAEKYTVTVKAAADPAPDTTSGGGIDGDSTSGAGIDGDTGGSGTDDGSDSGTPGGDTGGSSSGGNSDSDRDDDDDDSYSTGKDDKGNTGGGTTTPTDPTTPVNPTPTTPVTPDPATPVTPVTPDPTTPVTPDPATPTTPDQGGTGNAGTTDQGNAGQSGSDSGNGSSSSGTSSSSDRDDDDRDSSSSRHSSSSRRNSSSGSSSSNAANAASGSTTDTAEQTVTDTTTDGQGSSSDTASRITASIITDATGIAQTVKDKLDNALTNILKKDSKVQTGPYVKSDTDDIKVEIPTDLQKSDRSFYLMTATDDGDIVVLPNESNEDGMFEAKGEADTDYQMIFEDGETPLAGMITDTGVLDVAATEDNCYNHLIGLILALLGLIIAALLAKKGKRYFWGASAAGLVLALVASATGCCHLDWIFFACEVIVTVVATAVLWIKAFKRA